MAADLDSGEVVKPLKIDDGRSVFAGWPMIIFFAGMLVFTFHACTHMVAAGDTWVAMACGRHHSNHGVNSVEPFSANSHEAGPTAKTIEKWPGWAQSIAGKFELETIQKWHPTGWINQNWLTHTTFYQLAKRLGSDGEYDYNGLIYWKFILFTFEAFCIYFFARLIGVSAPSSAGAAAAAMFIGRSFFDVRPACYANLLAAILLVILALAIYKNYRYIWFVVPLTVFWANVHGGYIYVFLMMFPFIGIFLLATLPKKYSLGMFCIGMWSFLYLLSHKFVSDEIYQQVMKASGITIADGGITSDVAFRCLVLLVIIAIVLMCLKNLKMTIFYVYFLAASFIFLVSLMLRMSLTLPSNLTRGFRARADSFVSEANMTFYFILIFLLFVGVIVSFRKNNVVQVKPRAIVHTIGAGFAAFFAMVLFNPYHLTNLTHTFEVSVSKHAESWRSVNEWHPAFEMDNNVGDSYPFLYMFIVMWAALILWSFARFLKPKVESKLRARQQGSETEVLWPKIDIVIITVTALSVYMAVASRRFIPIAAAGACPLIALMLEQSVRMALIKINFNKNGKAVMPAIPVMFSRGVIIFAVVVTLAFGTVWGAKFKKIYIDPWPNDGVRDSVFMRMTASNVKPFDVCKFMRDNELSGNMFNYWTEGGAIAFGQTPDPETGRTPLQLFMDGRAQAAYDHSNFQLWRGLYGGGAGANKARSQKRFLEAGSDELKAIGKFLNKEMKKRDIWVFVLPTSQFQRPRKEDYYKVSYFPFALSTHPEWQLVYIDDDQRMYVNKTMPKGKELFNKVKNDKAKFPNEYSRNLTLSKIKFRLKPATVKQVNEAFEDGKKAFEISPSQAAMLQISYASRIRHLRKPAIEYAKKYVEDFVTNKAKLSEEGGYAKKLEAALVGAGFLSQRYSKSKNKSEVKMAREYAKYVAEFRKERRNISLEYKW